MQSGSRLLGAVAAIGLVLIALRSLPSGAAETAPQAMDESTDAPALSRRIDGFLAVEPLTRPGTRARCVLVPAVTDSDSGTVAGQALAQLVTDVDRVILLATGSQTTGPDAAVTVPDWGSLRTALGVVPVDTSALGAAASRRGLGSGSGEDKAAQAMVSVLPFLQRRLTRAFRIVPVLAASDADPSALAEMIAPLLREERTAWVVLTAGSLGAADLDSLFAPAESAAVANTHALPAAMLVLRALAGELGWKPLVTGLASPADGRALLSAVLVDDLNRVDLLTHAAKAAWDDPLTQAAFEDATRAAGRTNFQGDLLSQPEQAILLHLARSTILAKLRGETPPPPPVYSDTLARPSGCFVTLNLKGALRGCLGTVLPKEPLAVAVQRYAQSAAFEDKRFAPLTEEELAAVEIEIGALTPPARLEYRDGQDLLDKLQPGVHGVLVTAADGKRSTFLPQVWKQFPDKEVFLKALCRKGAIPVDAWQDPGKMTVEVYQSFDFRESPRNP
jgi:AmmeMemoRadiSam system protein A